MKGFLILVTYMELPLGYAAAEKLVIFIFGIASGSNPSTHWQSDFAAVSLSQARLAITTEGDNFILLNLFGRLFVSVELCSLERQMA